MRDVLVPFTINLYYNSRAKGDALVADKGPRPVDDGTPRVRRVRYGDITARDAHYAATQHLVELIRDLLHRRL